MRSNGRLAASLEESLMSCELTFGSSLTDGCALNVISWIDRIDIYQIKDFSVRRHLNDQVPSTIGTA